MKIDDRASEAEAEPEARVRRRIAVTLWVVGVVAIAAFLASFWVTFWADAGLTPFGVLGFVVTAFGVALAAGIYVLQKQASATEARIQRARHRRLERQLAAVEQALNDAQESRTGERLSASQSAQAGEILTELRNVRPGLVLWVDDNPDWVRNERRVLDGVGNRSVLVRSTEEAVDLLDAENRFDLVITDMQRRDELRAGYDLLEAIRLRTESLPVVLYSSSDDPDHRRQWLMAGGTESTYEPLGLFDAIAQALDRPAFI
jgi:CheY-like chemotaxis protein